MTAPHNIWLDVAARAAAEAVQALREAGAAGRSATLERGRDIKIEADRLLEDVIVSCLREHSPFPVLSEECGTVGRAHPEGWRWIVDPLDGSHNYSRGFPLFCVSVALWRHDEPLVGVVHDPVRDETFTGVVGSGAWVNGMPITTSAVADAARAVICTGFPVGLALTDAAIAVVTARVRAFKKVRLLGSAALSLSYVAAGRADAYAEEAIRVWDVAAGLALVRAAGGRITFARNDDVDSLNVTASNAFLQF